MGNQTKIILEGVIQTIPTYNGRIYSEDAFKKAIEELKNKLEYKRKLRNKKLKRILNEK